MSKTLLDEFTAYCKAYPAMRFWQALRNWNQFRFPEENFILVGKMSKKPNELWDVPSLADTFYRK